MSRTTQDITCRISPGGRALFDDGKAHEPVGHQSVMTIAVLLLNRGAQKSGKIALQAGEVGLPISFGVRDVWAKKDLGTQQQAVSREVPARSGAFLLLSPATGG